ncbi:MAG TPA: glycosyltransferase family 39 protein [Gaiellaceae bacterium]|nr:glycosyltransferase family 39 protein [Gaiellaceae bacterium]
MLNVRRTTALVAVVSAALAVLFRLPFFGAPLTADEGGYAEAARLWARGATLYRDIWVDRPQGLVIVFRAVLSAGTSTEAIRAAAAVVGALAVVATLFLALRLVGRTAAFACALLMATAGASPFIESFTLAGELLASLAAVLSLLAFTAYLRTRAIAWVVAAGLLTGCALMIKQSGFDAGLAIVAYLLWSERRRAAAPVGLLIGAAAAPLLAGALAAVTFHRWWFAVVSYRGSGDSLVTGSFVHRLDLFAQSLPGLAQGLGLFVLLAVLGWRGSPLLVRMWLGAGIIGVLGGGNFHTHYYIQLVPPLAILAGLGVEKAIARRAGRLALAYGAVAVATLVVTVPLWFDGPRAQAKTIWPHDPHLQHDAAVVRYVRAHTRPDQKVLVLWAAADVYYLADREPVLPYMWRANIESIPGVFPQLLTDLLQRKPALVAVAQSIDSVDKSDRVKVILAVEYRRVAVVDGVPIYAPRRPS